MYSSKYLEIKCKSSTMKLASLVEMQLLLYKDFFKHQAEALPHSESIQSFCVKNKVPYNIFSKWHKDTDVHDIIVKSSVNFLSHKDRALQSQFKQKTGNSWLILC